MTTNRTPGALRLIFLHGLLALCVLFLVPGRDAQAKDPVHPRLRPVFEQLHKRLHELADWCVAPKLFGDRRKVYELILEYWPDDAVALERTQKKTSHNLSKAGKPALKTHQARMADWYVQAVDEAMASASPAEKAAQHGGAIRMAVRLAPDYEEMRKQNGEVPGKVKGSHTKWILVETQRSRERRPELRKAAKKALAGVEKPVKTEPTDLDLHSSVQWAHGFKSKHGRIFGVMDAAEIKQTLVNAEAAFPFFAAAFRLPERRIRGLTFYSFDQTPNGNAYLAGQPNVTQQYLRFSYKLAALWIPKSSRVLIKTDRPLVRLEAAPRQVISSFLQNAVGVTSKQGWALEGFALYLTYFITGTRRLSSVRLSQYGEKQEAIPDLAKRLRDDNTDWLAEGRALIASKHRPDLRLLFGKTVNGMTPEEILYAYVVCVFLLEGHVDNLRELLLGFSEVENADYDAVVGAHLGYDVATLEARVLRWLDETRDLK